MDDHVTYLYANYRQPGRGHDASATQCYCELLTLLDSAQTDAYAEGRKDEREATIAEFAALLPGPYYMDPPDGGSVTVLEQFRRMAEDAKGWREQEARIAAAIACELRCEG